MKKRITSLQILGILLLIGGIYAYYSDVTGIPDFVLGFIAAIGAGLILKALRTKN